MRVACMSVSRPKCYKPVSERMLFSPSRGLGTLESMFVIDLDHESGRVTPCLEDTESRNERHSTQQKSSPRVLTPVTDLLLQSTTLLSGPTRGPPRGVPYRRTRRHPWHYHALDVSCQAHPWPSGPVRSRRATDRG